MDREAPGLLKSFVVLLHTTARGSTVDREDLKQFKKEKQKKVHTSVSDQKVYYFELFQRFY